MEKKNANQILSIMQNSYNQYYERNQNIDKNVDF